jgi:glycine cleavage system H protein
MEFPKNLRYTKDHEWARKDGAKIVIGVSAFAVEQLGDITQVDLPEVGAELKAGATFGTIESVKSVSDLYAPISGKVVEINESLQDSPELVNESCYEKGWMVAIAPTGNEYDGLMEVAAYSKLVADQQ